MGEPEEVQEAVKKEAEEKLKVTRKKYEDARRGLLSEVSEDIEVYVQLELQVYLLN